MRVIASIGAAAIVAVLAAGLLSTSHRPARNSPTLVAALGGDGLDLGGFGVAALPSPIATPPAATPPALVAAPPAKAAVAAPARPRPAITIGSTQQRLINQDRAARGLAPLTWSSCLASVARYEAAHLASPNVSFQHYDGVTRDLGCHLGRQVGENIGWYSGGINDAWMNSAFVKSPEHYANILGPYHYVATAWAVGSGGKAFIAVEFG